MMSSLTPQSLAQTRPIDSVVAYMKRVPGQAAIRNTMEPMVMTGKGLESKVKMIVVPGWGSIEIKNVVLDLNGTLTESGDFIPGVLECLEALSGKGFKIFVLSGDTRGTLRQSFQHAQGIEAIVTKTAREKQTFVESIGAEHTVCVGNGNIDVEMFKVARLSICTIQAEGATTKAMLQADIVVTHITQAFEILLDPNKLIATLRC